MIDPEETDNAINVLKNHEYQVIEITKTIDNFLEQCKESDTLYKTNFEKPFDRDIPSKPANSKNQHSSKPKYSNPKLSISPKSQKSSHSLKSHSSAESPKFSNHSRSSEKLFIEK